MDNILEDKVRVVLFFILLKLCVSLIVDPSLHFSVRLGSRKTFNMVDFLTSTEELNSFRVECGTVRRSNRLPHGKDSSGS